MTRSYKKLGGWTRRGGSPAVCLAARARCPYWHIAGCPYWDIADCLELPVKVSFQEYCRHSLSGAFHLPMSKARGKHWDFPRDQKTVDPNGDKARTIGPAKAAIAALAG